ncbi:MAG: 1,5-anhydro-D-fructose reductase (1,5-anhydro-D-mannitol-forming) [Paraglaciecola sp.]|jgi:1,5-anhydro-D-fructose reductase (1,5-anhydro-D-mannitol-forming)
MDPEQSNVRWGIIGCGDVCEIKSAPAYQQVSGFELSAVMSRDINKAKDFARRHNVKKYYASAQQLIDDPEIDAVYIATPPDSHCQYALMVAAANKICCVEKPMALDFAQCQKMQNAFSDKNIPLFVAYYRRCLPGFRALKNCLEKNEIGQPRHISWEYSRGPSASDISGAQNWRTQKDLAPGGYFDDIACHGLDIMTYLMGKVRQVSGFASNQQGLYSAYDAVCSNLLFESGATGCGSWNFGGFSRQDRVKILGSRGHIEFSIFAEDHALIVTQEGTKYIDMCKPKPIQLNFVQAIHDHLCGIRQHPGMAYSAAHTCWIMDNILT